MKQSTRTSSRKGKKNAFTIAPSGKAENKTAKWGSLDPEGMWRGISHGRARLEKFCCDLESRKSSGEIFVQCAKILSLRTAVLSSPKKQCHDPPLFGKILGCQREGKRKKSRSKAAGKQARRSDAALQRRTSSPRARKGSDDRDTKTLPNIPFHTGKGGRKPGGSMERHCKVHFTLQVQVKFEPESSDPIGAITENSPTSFTL